MKPTRRVLSAVIVAATAMFAACDGTGGLGDATAPAPAPQFSKGTSREAGMRILRPRNPLTQDQTYYSHGAINKQGGLLTFGPHSLLVQRNSVTGPTFFSATIRAGDEIKVDLRAWGPNSPVTTFQAPVKLTLYLGDIADTITDPNQIRVVYHNPFTKTLEPMPSAYNPRDKTVTATLTHFSDYSPATSRTDTTTTQP